MASGFSGFWRKGALLGIVLALGVAFSAFLAGCGEARDPDASAFSSEVVAQTVAISADASGAPKWDKATYEAQAGDITFVVSNPAPHAHQFTLKGNGVDYESDVFESEHHHQLHGEEPARWGVSGHLQPARRHGLEIGRPLTPRGEVRRRPDRTCERPAISSVVSVTGNTGWLEAHVARATEPRRWSHAYSLCGLTSCDAAARVRGACRAPRHASERLLDAYPSSRATPRAPFTGCQRDSRSLHASSRRESRSHF